MPLDPVIEAALRAAQGVAPYYTLPIAQARAQAKLAYAASKPQVPVGAVRDRSLPGPAGTIPIRVYTPAGPGPHPVLVFFHGSGFVILDLDTHDEICRHLCAGAGTIVVSVDYRLAPEHPYPAAPDDCLAATCWAAAHAGELGGDATRLAVAGDSAGGCLAAVTALRLRDAGGPALRAQLLLYPVTDYPSDPPDSYRRYGTGYGLTHEGMQWLWTQYLPDATAAGHPHVSPLRMDNPAGLPSTYVMLAEYDLLSDEGEAFARRLRDAGVDTTLRRCAGMNHGFLKYTQAIDAADAAMDDACAWLRQVLQAGTPASPP